jgi:predicted DNA-binding ribbon-helix-helix protein
MRATHAGRGGDQPESASGSLAAAGRPCKRSFTIGGHRTSISLEAAFWEALQAAAVRESMPVSRLIARIDADRKGCGLSSAVRVWLLAHYRNSAPPAGG